MAIQQTGTDRARDIRVEQVRLVFRSMRSSLYLGSALAFLLTLILLEPENQTILLGWLAAVVASRILCVSYASIALKRGIDADNTDQHIRHMCLIKILEGAAWGSLVWIVIGQASLAEQLLTLASLAGVSGNAVSLLAPVFPFYLSMQLSQLASMSSKLLIMDDRSFVVLAMGCTLYLVGQVGQALMAQRASRETLMLRFENLELIERLQIESERAESARGRAEEANLAKSKFLAAASHDLRQPVHAQELFLEVLARSELSPVQSKILSNARAASQASAQMLNTLLDFSRIEAGVVEPQRKAFRLQPLLHKLENELGSLADAKNLVYRCRETTLAVDSDPSLLELMLRNLITNAIRYTHTGGLLIGCRKRGAQVQIEIVDTGIGIAPDQTREIFREFHQLGNPERDRLKGLGLGLAITEGLANSLGHRISLVSQVGRGSTFRLHVPLARGMLIEDVFRPSSDTSLLFSQRLQGLRVLIVEDDMIVRQGMIDLLENWGCECRTAESLSEAEEQVTSWPVQALISDYRLRENQTGAQVISHVREVLGRQVPALIITGDTAPARLRDARSSGIPLLHKPVSPSQLYRSLISIVEASSVPPASDQLEPTGAAASPADRTPNERGPSAPSQH